MRETGLCFDLLVSEPGFDFLCCREGHKDPSALNIWTVSLMIVSSKVHNDSSDVMSILIIT